MINLLFHGQAREAFNLPAGSTLIKCGFYVNHNPDFLWIQNILAPLFLSDSKTRPWQMSFWAFADHSSTNHNSLILPLRAIYTNRSWLIEAPALGTFPFFFLSLNPLLKDLKEILIINASPKEGHSDSLLVWEAYDFISLRHMCKYFFNSILYLLNTGPHIIRFYTEFKIYKLSIFKSIMRQDDKNNNNGQCVFNIEYR